MCKIDRLVLKFVSSAYNPYSPNRIYPTLPKRDGQKWKRALTAVTAEYDAARHQSTGRRRRPRDRCVG